MLKIFVSITTLFLIFIHSSSTGQGTYKYSVDLKSAYNNTVTVKLITPKINSNNITFSFPKIIPGTYMISDFGKFISNVKAYNRKGHKLPVHKINQDQWEIKNATTLYRLSYEVEGIFDTKQKHTIYPMAATSIEEEDMVINSPGFFGYFEGFTATPVELEFKKPENYYASTSLVPDSTSPEKDIFKTKGLHYLYDEPILYSLPDTATLQVGNCAVLFSVYSPGQIIHAKEIAAVMQPVLLAVQNYLGGLLPANKYAFIYYFNNANQKHSFTPGLGGALEHMTSSFYYLPEMSIKSAEKSFLVDASTHEFFHIITPLTIASKEIKQFNFDSAVLSKHLWLYEGTTEYNAHYVQERYGLISPEEFLSRLTSKITQSRKQFNDTLPFTALSKGSAGIYSNQYGNVYQKGALIAACIDIYLLHLSGGKYGLHNLTHDLGKRYGVNKAFDDNTLFDEIGNMTYPEITNFLNKYVDGPTPIPYEYFFGLAGIRFIPKTEKKVLTFGQVSFDIDSTGHSKVSATSQFNEFGKAMGYKPGDLVYTFNGMKVTSANLPEVIDSLKHILKEGDLFTATVGRTNERGTIDTLMLSSKIYKVPATELNKLEFMNNPDEHQVMVQKAWLTRENDQKDRLN